MWFGPSGGTAFTASAKSMGLSSSNPLWKQFVTEVKALKIYLIQLLDHLY